jgi:hypothetical protein
LIGVLGTGAARAQDPRGARLGKPVALTPYAPPSAYLPPGAFDGAVTPAGGAPTKPAAPSAVVPAGWGDRALAPRPTGMPAPLAMPGAPVTGAPSGAPCAEGCDRLGQLCCGPCAAEECGWVRAEFLYWTVQGTGAPALVTRDVPGTPRGLVGLPGTPGQQTVFGGARLADDFRPGFRISAGWWLDECRLWAINGDFFYLAAGNESGRFGTGTGDPPFARPFFNVATGSPDAELVSYPGVLSGAVSVRARNTFAGAGAYLRRNLCCDLDECGRGYRIDALAGYRFYTLSDDLLIRENLLTAAGAAPVPTGTMITVTDRFRTENTFHGGLIGLSASAKWGRWSLDARGAAAIGNMRRELRINGTTVTQVPGAGPNANLGGLYAQPTNIGRYTSDAFTVIPEAGLTLGYQITPHVTAHVGYSFVYLSNVWRAGDQIDRGIDPAQLRGATSTLGRPAPLFASTPARPFRA